MNFEELEDILGQEVLDNPDLIDDDTYIAQYELLYKRPDGTAIVIELDRIDHLAKAIYLK